MMTTTAPDVTTIPRITHDEAMQIASVENRKFGDQLRSFDDGDWSKPTDCTLWDVRALAAHVVGSAAGQASPREFIRQVRTGRPLVAEIGGVAWWDGMNELQVRERASLTTGELIDEWDTGSARALRARRRLPRLIARLPLLNLPEPVGRQPISYLFDMGFTRDVWAHRIDLAVATGRAFDADEDHDGRILADIVAEWAGTHDEPFTLELDGPAGGTFRHGTGGETVRMDAVEFVRILAERVPGEGVLAHPLPSSPRHSSSVFCLAEGPSQEAVERVHQQAHGAIAPQIIEIDPNAPLNALFGEMPHHPPGTPYTAPAMRAIVFTDVCGSVAQTQQLGDAGHMALLREHNEIVRAELATHDGREVKHTGDGIMAAFASIASAVAFAVAVQRALRGRNENAGMPIDLSIGISAGEPVTDANDDLFGAAVQLAARLCDSAAPGDIFVSLAVRELCIGKTFTFEDRREIALKGFAEPVLTYAVRWRD